MMLDRSIRPFHSERSVGIYVSSALINRMDSIPWVRKRYIHIALLPRFARNDPLSDFHTEL